LTETQTATAQTVRKVDFIVILGLIECSIYYLRCDIIVT